MKKILVVWLSLLIGSLCFDCEAAGRFHANQDNLLCSTGTVTDANSDPLRDLADWNTVGLPSNLWHPVQSHTVAPALHYRIIDQNDSCRKNIINLSFKLQIDLFKVTYFKISALRSFKHYYILGLQKLRC